MNIYNIPSNFKFLPSLQHFICKKIDVKRKILLILPNKKSCQEFLKSYLVNQSHRIKVVAISDLNLDDIAFLKDSVESINASSNLFNIKANDVRYIYELINELKKTAIFTNYSISTLIPIAKSLKSLFDDLSKSDIDISKINLGDYNLASHRQFSINFLQNFYYNFVRIAREKEIFTKAELLKQKIDYIANQLQIADIKNSTIIMAGTTGSVDYVKRLIKVVTSKDNGFLVLQGFQKRNSDTEIDDRDPAKLFFDLFEKLGFKNEQVKQIKENNFLKISNKNNDFANEIFSSNKMSQLKNNSLENLKIIEAENEVSQVRNIVKLIADKSKNSKIAVISTDYKQTSILRNVFKVNDIDYSDNESKTLAGDDYLALFLASIKVIDENLSTDSILNLMHNKYISKVLGLKTLVNFESLLLRSYRKSFDILNDLKEIDDNQFDKINKLLGDLDNLSQNIQSANIYQVFEKISNLILDFAPRSFENLSTSEDCEIFSEMKEGLAFLSNIDLIKGELQQVFAQIFNFYSINKVQEVKNIEIISTIESRLIDYDLVIIASCNNGIFPQMEPDNWLSGKVRNQLAIDSSDKLVSLAAYDFCNLLNNPNVIISYCKKIAGNDVLKSQFLSRLQLKAESSKLTIETQYLTTEEFGKRHPPNNDLPLINLPNVIEGFSATQISQLIHNPYSYYAKNILKLEKQKKLDYQPGSLEFGIFMHHLVEKYTKSEKFDFDSDVIKCFYKFYHCQESKLIYLPRSQKTLESFVKLNDILEFKNNFTEQGFKAKIADFTINAKIDRISAEDSGYNIFDYKTGSLPSKKDVLLGKEVQMPLYAMIFNQDQNKNIEILPVKSISYWKVGMNESKISTILKGIELEEFLERFSINLTTFFEFLAQNEVSFRKSNGKQVIDDYYHLSRVK